MSEEHNSPSPGAIQVKNWWKTTSVEEKLDVIDRLEKGEQVVDICRNARLPHSCVHAVCDNSTTIKGATSWNKVFVHVARLSQLYQNKPYEILWMWVLHFYCIWNKYIVQNVCILYRSVCVCVCVCIYIYIYILYVQ